MALSLVDLSKVKIETKSREKKDSVQTLICRVMPFFPELSPNQPTSRRTLSETKFQGQFSKSYWRSQFFGAEFQGHQGQLQEG